MSRKKMLERIGGAIGSGAARTALRNAGGRVTGKLLTATDRWDRLSKYVRKHFNEKLFRRGERDVHGVFAKKYRDPQRLQDLVRQAADKPSHAPYLSRLTRNGKPVGQPAIVIERDFGKEIGYSLVRNDKTGEITTESCSILKIITDITGNPISIYPVSKFENGAKGMTAAAVALVLAVESAHAAEEEARDQWRRGPCEDDWWTSLLAPIMLDSACIGNAALPPRELLDHRAAEMIARIERELGGPLDGYTRASIRKDVAAIWFYTDFTNHDSDDEAPDAEPEPKKPPPGAPPSTPLL